MHNYILPEWNSPPAHTFSVEHSFSTKNAEPCSNLHNPVFVLLCGITVELDELAFLAWFLPSSRQESIVHFLTYFIVAFFVKNSIVCFQSFRYTCSIIEKT